MNKDVSRYIERQKPEQKKICQKLRKIIHSTFPGIKEEMKMGVPWYEGKYYIVALKDHVNMGFSVKRMSAKDRKNFEGSGNFMRHIKFFSTREIDEKKIARLLKKVKSGC